VIVLTPAQTLKQLTQQSGVLQGWLEWEMTTVQGSIPVGPRHELSVDPTLCAAPPSADMLVFVSRLNFLVPLNFLVTAHTC